MRSHLFSQEELKERRKWFHAVLRLLVYGYRKIEARSLVVCAFCPQASNQ